jgi:putative transposase
VPTRVIVDYIASYKDRFGVEPIVEVLNEHGITIAPSTYYDHAARGFGPTTAELEEAYATNEIHDLWVANRQLYGVRSSLGLSSERVEQ